MLGWLFRRRRAPLEGAPAGRRRKTYSAQSGYVYQYSYEGFRERPGDTEYVFTVSAGSRVPFTVSVLLPDEVLADWERVHDFALRPNERHGVVKIALFQAFDERANPGRMRAAVLVRRADLEAIVQTLGII
jgi:hypothetical protein